MNHLYWHFLVYQNFLDSRAEESEARGKDGSLLRNDLQKRLGFSDADFASIRASSRRLASELKPLNDKAKSLAAIQHSSSSVAQWKALTAQRDAYISAEIKSIKQTLSPAQVSSLETFLTQFFAPKNVIAPPHPPAASALPAVQP